MESNLQRAYLADDGSGHAYLLPYDLTDHFTERLSEAEQTEECIDNGDYGDGYTFDSFEEEFGDYRVEGDYYIYANFPVSS